MTTNKSAEAVYDFVGVTVWSTVLRTVLCEALRKRRAAMFSTPTALHLTVQCCTVQYVQNRCLE